MAIYTRRVQAILTEEQYRQLTRLARRRHQPVSVLVRQAIEQTYMQGVEAQARRRAALADLLSLELPAPGWDTMEAEIIAGALEQ